MNRIVIILVATVLCTCMLAAQPLSGSYTIGGTTPDFVTLQDAGNALKLRGVAGPTFFNIRPGTYSRSGDNNTVLRLDSIVAGLSSANRITFQPDAAAAGNVNNVIMQLHITTLQTTQALVHVGLDYVSFRNLTFAEHDSSNNQSSSNLVQLQTSGFNSPTIDGIQFEGCKFVGSTPSGTENGIEFGQGVADITIRRNTFLRMLRGVSGLTGTAQSRGTLVVEDNQFLAGWRSASGSGNPLGSAMETFCQNLTIRKNLIDFAGSFNGGNKGITVVLPSGTQTVIIDRNSISGSCVNGLYVQGFIGGTADSLVIANNMLNTTGSIGLSFTLAGNAKIFFNTIVIRGGGLVGLQVEGPDCVVLDNIIIVKAGSGFNVGYAQSNSTNLRSDYNIVYMALNVGSSGPLVIRNGAQYATLGAYQIATGLDTNSHSKNIDFVDSANVHITDCQSQDPDLKGIPVLGITVDIDGDIRSTTTPMIGADENSFAGFGMFADPFKAGLAGTAFSIAADNFDNLLFDGLAVPDYDNRQVRLYHNLPPRSFALSGTLSTGFKPTVVKFFDLDRDNNLDLIVGGDTTALKVFWGDGVGNFPSDTTIITVSSNPFFSGGRVRSLDTGRVSFVVNSSTILITEDDGFLPNTSYLAYLDNDNRRHLVHHVISRPGIPARPDTIPAVLADFVVGNLDGSSDPEVAALTIAPLPPAMYVFNDTNAQGGGGFMPFGTRYRYQLGTGSSPGHASSVISGDFDGDTDLDLVALSTSSSCVFIRNQGSFSFASTPISVAGAQALVRMDYENDGDLDFATLNERIETNGITVFLNDGTGNFTPRENCFFPFASGRPFGATASDFDQDGKTDIAVVAAVATGVDSLFVLYNLGGGVTHVQGGGTREVPAGFTLEQNYPNPFNPSTRIEYELPARGYVSIRIYNLLGQEVALLVGGEQTAGHHVVEWDGKSASSGVYFYRLTAGNFTQTRKMMLMK